MTSCLKLISLAMKNDNSSVLHYVQAGNPNNHNPTMIFIHGWPDDEKLWSYQMNTGGLSDNYYCCALRLPNSSTNNNKFNSFPDMVKLIYNTIKIIQKKRLKESEKIILVGHDWGAHLCYLIEREYPDIVSKLITIDVGYDISFTFTDMLVTIMYQFYLALAYCIGLFIPFIGTMLVRAFASLCQIGQGTPTSLNRINCYSAHFYAYFHAAMWFRINYSSTILNNYKPLCPILFIYPTGKRGMTPVFHSNKMLIDIHTRKDNSSVVEIKNAGHWVVHHQASTITSKINYWLNEYQN